MQDVEALDLLDAGEGDAPGEGLRLDVDLQHLTDLGRELLGIIEAGREVFGIKDHRRRAHRPRPRPPTSLVHTADWVAVRRASETRQERLAAFMTHEPQTNEVRRAICLLGGFLEVAQATGLPLRCFEVAASAGLNLSWDRFHYRLGAATWGDPSSPVTLDTEWSGPPPPIEAPVYVIERAACDRRPSGIATEAERRRLTSYIWADQTERLARLRAAIGMALGRGVEVEAADAVDWVRAHVAPKAATATVLYHSVFWQYMPASKQVELEGLIREIGAKASAEAPFAWLSMEPPPENLATMQVRLIMWPGGEPRILAEVHPHGAYVNWLCGANPS